MRFLIPNLISLSRVAVGIWFLFFGTIPLTSLQFLALVLISATDMIDGWIARKLDSASKLGAVIDTVADKLFVLIMMFKLVLAGVLPYVVFSLVMFQYLLLPLGNWFHIKRYSKFPSSNHVTRIAAILPLGMLFTGVVMGNPTLTITLGVASILMNFLHLAHRVFLP